MSGEQEKRICGYCADPITTPYYSKNAVGVTNHGDFWADVHKLERVFRTPEEARMMSEGERNCAFYDCCYRVTSIDIDGFRSLSQKQPI